MEKFIIENDFQATIQPNIYRFEHSYWKSYNYNLNNDSKTFGFS